MDGEKLISSSHLLRVVSSVEVVPGNAALGAGHVPADDEVRAPEVLADHHVLHRLFRGEGGGQGVRAYINKHAHEHDNQINSVARRCIVYRLRSVRAGDVLVLYPLLLHSIAHLSVKTQATKTRARSRAS